MEEELEIECEEADDATTANATQAASARIHVIPSPQEAWDAETKRWRPGAGNAGLVRKSVNFED